MPTDIAIIGVAGRFPHAHTLESFHAQLSNGYDAISDISEDRVINTSLDFNKNYKPAAFLDGIANFDHKFFNISRAEADHMDPHQRVLMEVIYEMFESAGYTKKDYFGTNTAVFVSDTHQEYYKLADAFDPTLLTGSSDSATAGRISRFFGLRGMATMLDTACSSALLAIHLACKEIISGDAPMAIATGVRLLVLPDTDEQSLDMGILSFDGKTKSFSAEADGTGVGEAAASILLKPLEQAEIDGDIIYGVIKASAASQDADQSGSLTAPSAEAQAKALSNAWKKAQIDVTSINYIETHGSGTKLGDPIEINGIDLAFKEFTDKKGFCHVSSVKTNIGHTGNAAGITGFVKALLAVKHGVLYPSLHFTTPNPFINFNDSATVVTKELTPWISEDLRRAGVNSFGLSGTNCHVVLEQYLDQRPTNTEENQKLFFPFSAKTEKSLKALLETFKEWLPSSKTSLSDISYTLCFGRDHYQYKVGIVASTANELLNKLNDITIVESEQTRLMFLFSGQVNPVNDSELLQNHTYATAYEELTKSVANIGEAAKARSVQLAMYNTLMEMGIVTEELLGVGDGDETVAHILKEITYSELISNTNTSATPNLYEKLKKLVAAETADEHITFLELGPTGELSATLNQIKNDFPHLSFDVLTSNHHVWETISTLYGLNITPKWEKIKDKALGKRVRIPTYQFDSVRCWLQPESQKADNNNTPKPEKEPATIINKQSNNQELYHLINNDWTATEQTIAKAWIDALKPDSLRLDDDFFRLGGHSLIAIKIIGQVESTYKIKLQFTDANTIATVRNFAEAVDNHLATHGEGSPAILLQHAPTKDAYPVAHAQKRLWLLQQHMPHATNYNLPTVLKLVGTFDVSKANQAWQQLVDRHESLRTYFQENNGQVEQIIAPSIPFRMEEIMLSEESSVDQLMEDFVRPFDTTKAPLLRVSYASNQTEQFILFDMHHIISDGISLAQVAHEFIQLYQGKPLLPVDYQYKDFACWEHNMFTSGAMDTYKDFWINYLTGATPLDLPLDNNRPEQRTFDGDSYWINLSDSLINSLETLAQNHSSSLYMVMLASYNVLLYKYTHQNDITVGSPNAGRTLDGLQQVIGMFVNTIVNRNHPTGEKNFESFLAEVKQNALATMQHQDYPYDAMVNEIGSTWPANRNPLFDTMFVLQNIPAADTKTEHLAFEPVAFENKTALFDITFEVNYKPNHDAALQIMFNTHLFEKATIELMAKRWIAILENIVASPNATIDQLSWTTPEEITVNNLDNELDFDF